MQIKLHTNEIQDLDQAIELSINVFNPTTEDLKKYHDRNDWLKKIEDNGLLITAWDGPTIVGFSICYKKELKLHIWNVGVLDEYRKHGVWKMMHTEIIKFAKNNGYTHLTLNTYKAKFPGMYAFAIANGYVEYKTEGDKSRFSKVI